MLDLQADRWNYSTNRMIYICAGMARSGSTWLYNAARLTLQHAGVQNLAAGWTGDKRQLLTNSDCLIKVHNYDPELAATNGIILTSHRDLRDVAASLVRKFKTPNLIETLRVAVQSHALWCKVAAYDLRYENLLSDRLTELHGVARALRLPSDRLAGLPIDAILDEIAAEKFSENRSTAERFDKVNLLHDGHITDGRHGSWDQTLTPEFVKEIETEFHDWLAERNYLQ